MCFINDLGRGSCSESTKICLQRIHFLSSNAESIMVKPQLLLWVLFIARARTCDHSRSLQSNDSRAALEAVEECDFDDPNPETVKAEALEIQSWKRKRQSRSGNVHSVPVYVHILDHSSGGTIMTDDVVGRYFSYINTAFDGSGFVFNHMGTTRRINEPWSNDCKGYQRDYKQEHKVGGMETLNLYICNSIPKGDGKFLAGFTYAPSDQVGVFDGINLLRPGSADEEEPRANTLVHELVRCLHYSILKSLMKLLI